MTFRFFVRGVMSRNTSSVGSLLVVEIAFSTGSPASTQVLKADPLDNPAVFDIKTRNNPLGKHIKTV
jgi:hypothetical protein